MRGGVSGVLCIGPWGGLGDRIPCAASEEGAKTRIRRGAGAPAGGNGSGGDITRGQTSLGRLCEGQRDLQEPEGLPGPGPAGWEAAGSAPPAPLREVTRGFEGRRQLRGASRASEACGALRSWASARGASEAGGAVATWLLRPRGWAGAAQLPPTPTTGPRDSCLVPIACLPAVPTGLRA